MSTRKKKYANPGTDGSDGLLQVHPNSVEGPAAVNAKKMDLIALEYGPLFSFGQSTVHGNQVALGAKFSRDLQVQFDADAAEYVRYESATGLWATIKEPAVKMALARFIKEQAEENEATDFLHKRTNSFLGAILQLLKGFTLPTSTARAVGVIHLGNGMLDLTQTPPVLRKANASDWSRRRCAIAFKSKAKCKRFLKELLGSALSSDDIDLLQRFFGAVLLGDNTAQRFLLVAGEAARGKSTVVTLIERIVGLEIVAHLRTQHLSGRFETHAFLNKTLLTAKDVAGNFLEHQGAQLLKALVGDDLMEAEAKYAGKTRMRGRFNIIITTNNRLRLAMEEDAPAWRRRLLVIKFAGDQPEKRFANFAEVLLTEESEGILAWMIEGAIKHLKELGEIGDFHLTAAQQTRIDDLIDSSRSPEIFVRAAITPQQGGELAVEDLTQAYVDFCTAKDWEPLSARQFEHTLTNLMQRIHRVLKRNDLRRGKKTLRGFKHVALLRSATDPKQLSEPAPKASTHQPNHKPQ